MKLQVELISSDTVDMVEIRCIVTLNEASVSSELVVSNFRSSSLQLAGSIISHLTVSTPEANYAVGLEGSDFFNMSPVSSNFVIIPPENSEQNNFIWSPMRFLSALGARNEKVADAAHISFSESDEEMQGEENDSYKQLKEKMSRIYTSAPTNFTIIDRVIFSKKFSGFLSLLSKSCIFRIHASRILRMHVDESMKANIIVAFSTYCKVKKKKEEINVKQGIGKKQ